MDRKSCSMNVFSVSRREDIPAFRWQSFMNMLDDGKINYSMMGKVYSVPVNPAEDCFVFWTKNPYAAAQSIDQIKDLHQIWQVTATGYNRDWEPHVPSKLGVVVPAMHKLADAIGARHIVWRYDPIAISDKYSVAEHVKRFEMLANAVHGASRTCTISFLDVYGKLVPKLQNVMRAPNDDEIREIISHIVPIAHAYNMRVVTCAEKIDLSAYGVEHGKCIDPQMVANATGKTVTYCKDPTQRVVCGCMKSIDIGSYRQCSHGCLYCYAN